MDAITLRPYHSAQAPSDQACSLDPAADPTAEAEGSTGAQQGQGAGDLICICSLLEAVLHSVYCSTWSIKAIVHCDCGWATIHRTKIWRTIRACKNDW